MARLVTVSLDPLRLLSVSFFLLSIYIFMAHSTPPKDPKLEELEQQLESQATELEQFKIGWQRCQADFDNYRKRNEREQTLQRQSASLETLLALAPIVDNFRRAFGENSTDTTAWSQGVEQIYKQLEELLRAGGLERLDVTGKEFNPSEHEAISQLTDPTTPEGHIMQEVESGYRYHGIIVRPAKVVVSTGNPASTEETER